MILLRCTGCGSDKTIEEIHATHPEALSCCPERDIQPVAVYLREIDGGTGNAWWVVCAKGDRGATMFVAHKARSEG